MPAGRKVMFKVTLPEVPDFYAPLIKDKRVVRVVALSGGYTRDDACKRLAKNHGMIASFSRALAEGLKRSMSDAEFDKELAHAIDEIYRGLDGQGLSAWRSVFYYASGSPYAWRVWLALERKGVPYHRKTLSFDAGDLKTAEFGALNPRRRVPVLVDDDFALAESAAIVEYIEDRWPLGPALFASDPRRRAIQRRMVREADQYLAPAGNRFVTGEGSEDTLNDLRRELALWEDAATADVSYRRTFGGRSHGLSVHGALPSARRPQDGFRQGRRHRTASRRLDRSHAGASHRSAHLAAALERSRSGLTARGARRACWRARMASRIVRQGTPPWISAAGTVFLFDVDNTLLDNDRIQHDLRERLQAAHGDARVRALLGDLRGAMGRCWLRRLFRRARAPETRTSL